MIRFAVIVSALLTNSVSHQQEDNVLHIGGIFPIGGKGGWQGGQACKPAVMLALEDVNKHSILSGYQLKLHWNDSEVIRSFRNECRFPSVVFFSHSMCPRGWVV